MFQVRRQSRLKLDETINLFDATPEEESGGDALVIVEIEPPLPLHVEKMTKPGPSRASRNKSAKKDMVNEETMRQFQEKLEKQQVNKSK